MQLQVAMADPNEPRAPLRFNFDCPSGWEPIEYRVDHLPFFLQVFSARLVKYVAWTLLLVAQSSSADRRGAQERVRHLWWNRNTMLGWRQPRAGFAGRISHATASLCPIACPKLVKVTCRENSRAMVRIPMTLRAVVCPASRNFPPCLLVHVVPSSFDGVRALSDMSSVGGTRAHTDVCERPAVSSVCWSKSLRCLVRSGFRRISPSHLVGLVEKIHMPRSKCPSRSLRYTRFWHTSSRLSLMFFIGGRAGVACHVH